MRSSNILLSILFLATVALHSSDSMQCYVCKNEYDNLDKCLDSVEYCKRGEDRCLSEISWKRPSHWVADPIRHYGLTKSCATNDKCESLKYRTRFNCTYNKNEDWNCAECCEGSLCNYYITMKATAVKFNLLLLIGCIVIYTELYFTKN